MKCGFSHTQYCEVLRICDTESGSPERNHDLFAFILIEFTPKPIPSVLYDTIINGYVMLVGPWLECRKKL